MVPRRLPFIITFPQDSIAYIASSWGDLEAATVTIGVDVIASLIKGGVTLLEY